MSDTPTFAAPAGWPTYTLEQDGIARIHFSSIDEVIAISETIGKGPTRAAAEYSDTRDRCHDSTYRNGYDRKTLREHFESPPDRLVSQIAEMRTSLEHTVELPLCTTRRWLRNLDDGDEVDFDRWKRGEFDRAFAEMRRVVRPKPVARIAVNLSISSGRNPSELLYRGAAAAAIADIWCASGYSVEIVAFNSVNSYWLDGPWRGRDKLGIVTVKRADMPLDLGSVAFSLAEIAFYRLAFLDAEARCGPPGMSISYGYGYCCNLFLADRAGFDVLLDGNVLTRDGAIEAVKQATKLSLVDRAVA